MPDRSRSQTPLRMRLEEFVAAVPDLALTTERLLLRPMRAADVPTCVAHEQNRATMRWIRDPVPLAEIEARVRSCLEPWDGADGKWLLLMVERRADQQVLGIVCCRVTDADHETMEIGYRLDDAFHRQGYGEEATRALITHLFGAVGVRKLIALCAVENEASWRLMRKLGMTEEARLREYSRLDGAWRDEFVYGLLRREWR